MAHFVFAGLVFLTLIYYFDDCVIGSNDHHSHLADLENVLDRYIEYDLVLKGSKCQIAVNEIKFHGFLVTQNTISHLPDRIVTVFEFPRPATPKKMHSYLGMSNYFHSFIRNYALIRQPLNAMPNERKLQWTPLRYHAFYALKDAIRSIPRLFHVDYDLPIYVDADASKYGFMGYCFQLGTSHLPEHHWAVADSQSLQRLRAQAIELENAVGCHHHLGHREEIAADQKFIVCGGSVVDLGLLDTWRNIYSL
jgi:hypothetical protein